MFQCGRQSNARIRLYAVAPFLGSTPERRELNCKMRSNAYHTHTYRYSCINNLSVSRSCFGAKLVACLVLAGPAEQLGILQRHLQLNFDDARGRRSSDAESNLHPGPRRQIFIVIAPLARVHTIALTFVIRLVASMQLDPWILSHTSYKPAEARHLQLQPVSSHAHVPWRLTAVRKQYTHVPRHFRTRKPTRHERGCVPVGRNTHHVAASSVQSAADQQVAVFASGI
jgi:hypothetical protein